MARKTLELRLKKGDRVGRWTLVRKLGEGGMGSVWQAAHANGQQVAIKFLERVTDRIDRERFAREIGVLRRIRHPRRGKPVHVVRYHDDDIHEGFPYLVMEYMPGGSLRDLLDRKKRLPAEDAAWTVIQCLRGLRTAGTYHRDLKPENLLLTDPVDGKGVRITHKDGKPGAEWRGSVVKVADFGLAKDHDQETALTMSRQVMGTPLYMAPEQCRRTRDALGPADLYACGVMLFEMVVGKVPFEGETAYDTMTKHCNDPVPWPKDLDPAMRRIIERALQKRPEDRYRKPAEMERDLCQFAGLDEPEPEPFPWGWVIAGIAFVVVITVVVVMREHFFQVFERIRNAF